MRVDTEHKFGLTVANDTHFARTVAADKVWERPETEAVKELLRPDDLFIDVGAHVGYYTCLAASCGATVLAFEPNPYVYPLLVENVALSGYKHRIITLDFAIDECEDEHDFYLPAEDDDCFGSLRPGPRVSSNVTVRTCPLADFVPLGDRVRMLKTDTEGAELHVLRGFARHLAYTDYVLIEIVDEHLQRFGTNKATVTSFLDILGFKEARDFGDGNFLFRRVGAA